jgi:hypothetical protein
MLRIMAAAWRAARHDHDFSLMKPKAKVVVTQLPANLSELDRFGP